MKNLIELHLIQNFAPSNLNRDDTGSPKDAIFGTVRRARISSQCIKRVIRHHFREAKLIDEENLAWRTKRATARLTDLVVVRGHPRDEATAAVIAALAAVSIVVKKKNDEFLSEYLLYLGEQEMQRVAELIHEHWADLVGADPSEGGSEGQTAKDKKKAAKQAVSSLTKPLVAALDGGKAVDLALFGRMVADKHELMRDAAAQVAHAISTHKVEREFDFYTAVDDLKPEDNAGADMLGTIEFASACFYRYSVVDLAKLRENLDDDVDLALMGIEAFVRATIAAIPTGKQNTFAAHNPPSFVGITVRSGALPRSLVNAFEKPISPRRDQSLSTASTERLGEEWAKLDACYGTGALSDSVYVDLTQADPASLQAAGAAMQNVEDLVGAAMAAVRRQTGS